MTANPFAALLDGVPDYDAGLLNDYGGGNVEWWQDYLRAEIGRANDAWRENVLAALAAVPADLAGAGKVLEKTVWVVFNDAPNMGGAPAYVTRHDPRPLPLDKFEAVEFARADLITALLARLAAQEAQIAEALKKWAREYGRADATETALAAMTKERDELREELLDLNKQFLKKQAKLQRALAAERAKVAKLVEAGKRVLAPLDEPCRHDHHGYCQAHFIEADCSVAALRAAITEAGQ